MQLHISQRRHRPWVFGLGAALMALVSTAQLPLTAGTPPSRPEHNPKFDPLDRPSMARRGLMPKLNFSRSDAWVAKYKDQPITGGRRLLWRKQLGTSFDDYSADIATDSTGNIFISGSTLGNLGGSNKGLYDAWVAKYSPNGTLLWTKQLGTKFNDYSYSVETDSTGNIFISGATEGKLGVSNEGLSDAWVAKYSPDGILLWTKQLGTKSNDYSYSVETDSIGNIFISGDTEGNLGGSNQRGSDAWVAKYSPDGILLWIKQLGSSSYDLSYSVATDSTGNIFISGSTKGNLGGSNQGSDDAWVAKYSPNGTLLWINQLGSSGFDNSYGVATNSRGKVFIVGGTNGNLGGSNQGSDDAWVAKYTPNGLRSWVRQEGTPQKEYSSSVATDGSGDVVMTGFTLGNFSRD